MKHSFDFALTTYCQAKCRSCARTNQETGEKETWVPLQHMKLDVFEKRLKATQGHIEFSDIEFCGEFGDPMMHPQIDDFIDTALKYAPEVSISTNGGLRQPEWYKSISQKYKDKLIINFAIDGTDHDTNWKYREGVDFQRAMDNMIAFTRGGGNRASWWFLIFDWNWHQVPLAKQMADELDIRITFNYNRRWIGLITPENKKASEKLYRGNNIQVGFDDG